MTINLEKLEGTPLLDLSKKAAISLEKKGMSDHEARVALVLDISGSMGNLYDSGKVQAFAEKVLGLGTRFDNDGAIDVFLFGSGAYYAGEMKVENFSSFLKDALRKYPLEGSTNYGKAIKAVRTHYLGEAVDRTEPLDSDIPVYVMFLTDGQTQDQAVTTQQVKSASYEPIFWQFMGIGRTAPKKGWFGRSVSTGEFSFLESLDDMRGRYTDNADFFSVSDPNIPDDEVYDLMMVEYPDWYKKAKNIGLVSR